MFMLQRKKLVLFSIVALMALGIYLQFRLDGDSREFAESTKEVIEQSGSTYVSSEFDEMDFFSKAKLDREIALEKSKESLRTVMASSTLSQDLEADISKELEHMVGVLESEQKIETLVMEKGYQNVFVAIAQDGSLDMVVKAQSLSEAEVAQIADIASRHANIPMDRIHVSNK